MTCADPSAQVIDRLSDATQAEESTTLKDGYFRFGSVLQRADVTSSTYLHVDWLNILPDPPGGWCSITETPVGGGQPLSGSKFDYWEHINEVRGANFRITSREPVVLSDNTKIHPTTIRFSHHTSYDAEHFELDEQRDMSQSDARLYVTEVEFYCPGRMNRDSMRIYSNQEVWKDRAIVTRQLLKDDFGNSVLSIQMLGEKFSQLGVTDVVQEHISDNPVTTLTVMSGGESALKDSEQGIHAINIVRSGYMMDILPSVAAVEHLVTDLGDPEASRYDAECQLRTGQTLPPGDWIHVPEDKFTL